MSAEPAVCEFTIEGNPDGPTLVFVHGWPDDASLWRRQVEALGARFRCVLLTLPNFGDTTVKPGGFDFPELVERLAATVRRVQPAGQAGPEVNPEISPGDGPGVGLVTHDWGAYLGYLLEQKHPELVARMAALDIGAHLGRPGLKASLIIMGYQWSLVAAWLVGGLVPPLGAWLSRGVGKLIGVPARQRARLRSRFNYPYFYMWRNLLLPRHRGKLLSRYRPRCPLLFLWGERKPLMFHSPQWLRIVADSGGRAEGVAGAGHWLMETHAALVNERLAAWFADL